jgi:hypothetical protein
MSTLMRKMVRKAKNALSHYEEGLKSGIYIATVKSKGKKTFLDAMPIDEMKREVSRKLKRGGDFAIELLHSGVEFELNNDPDKAKTQIKELPAPPTRLYKTGDKLKAIYVFDSGDSSRIEGIVEDLAGILPNRPTVTAILYDGKILNQEEFTLPLEETVRLGKPIHLNRFVYQAGIDAWFTPLPLEFAVTELPTLHKGCMPSLLYQYCNRVANQIPCPIDYVFTPLLVLIGSIIGHKIHLKVDPDRSMIVACLLWGIYIGESGTGKTPALETVLFNLQLLIDKARYEHEKKHKDQKANNEVGEIEKSLEIEAIKKAIRLAKNENDEIEYKRLIRKCKQLLAAMNEQLSATSLRKYKTSNTTLPALLNILSKNPNGIVIVLDELKGFLARLSAKENEELRAFTLECARGFGSYDADRVSRNSVSLQDMALSIVGGIQPDSFKPYLDRIISGTSDNDGWIHRFPMLTQPLPVQKISDDIKPLTPLIEKTVEALFLGIDDSEFSFDRSKKLKERFVTFTDDAQVIYDQWVSDNFAKCCLETTSPLMKSHLRKYDSVLAAIALIFQVVMSLDKKSLELRHFNAVSARALRKAIKLLEYLEMHAARLFDKHISVTLQNAQTLLKKLPTLNKTQFTAHEIAWKEWAGMRRDTDAVTEALLILERHFYIRRVKKVKGKQGRSTTVWELNPMAM